jgi:hypothetical protein
MYATELDVDDRAGQHLDDEPPAPVPYRRDFYLTVVVTIFTMAQVWAVMVILATSHSAGPTQVAIWVTLAGSLVAVLVCWHHVLRRDRQYIAPLSRT